MKFSMNSVFDELNALYEGMQNLVRYQGQRAPYYYIYNEDDIKVGTYDDRVEFEQALMELNNNEDGDEYIGYIDPADLEDDEDLDEAKENNNYRSNTAKEALIKKWMGKVENNNYNTPEIKQEIKNIKARSILHHINGNHNDDEQLMNDVLIIADNAKEAKLAHKILHLLSYCYIQKDLENKLKELDVEFFYQPDGATHAKPVNLVWLATELSNHDKRLRDIALIDYDEEDLDLVGNNRFDNGLVD